jgi:hypothetical protein
MQHPKHLSQMAATGSMTPLESSDINIVSDIDGTTNRVASVTLESDSLSETPKSFRNKRRKRLPKREKFMRLDNDGKEQRQPSTTTSISNSDREDNPGSFF